MTYPLTRPGVLFFLAMVNFLPVAARAQASPGAEVRPTVTAADGDAGGRFFGQVPDPALTQHYYIAAEPELWDYAPSGRDEICGTPLPAPLLSERKASKLRYVQYTDETFSAKVIPNRSLGILGPALRGVVGEYLAVTFLNRTDQPLSMHPHGVKYDKDSEGAHYFPNPGRGSAVAPGARFTYVWHLDENSGPMPDEPSSKGWLYHSHVTGDADINLGLVGLIIVTDPKRARADGTPRDVDRELAALFMIFDESGLDAAAIEAAEYAVPGAPAPPVTWAEIQQSLEQGSRFAINGTVFGNLPGLQVNEGERVRWYLFALGSEDDFHTAHWHGLRVVEEGRRRTDVIDLLPATMKVADMVADNPGSWLFHCHVAEHMKEGMFAQLVVHGRDTVGVDRSPERAFLGYPAAAQSLRIARVDVRKNTGSAEPEWQMTIEGVVTAYDGYAVFNETVRLQIGDRRVEFRPDMHGEASGLDAIFRVKNANDYGVVRGGLMEFEVILRGSEWAEAAGRGNLTLALDLARTHHVASSPVRQAGVTAGRQE